jgi:uncharacterized protein YjiS (DUF1127 family)
MFQIMRQPVMLLSDVALFHGKVPKLEQPNAIGKLMQLIERAHQRKALAELDKDQLDDIGISREEARREARKRIWE